MQPLSLEYKLHHLREIVAATDSALVAYSGGIDSTVVLKVAYDQLGDSAVGVTAISPTFPAVELDAATRVCLLYTSPSPRDRTRSRMPSSA